jgi:hypothetical protein
MRKFFVFGLIGLMLVISVTIFSFAGSRGVSAQAEPTATFALPGLFGGTPNATEAPSVEATPEADAGLPLLWIQIDTGFAPLQVDDVTVGGPVDTYAYMGDPCAQGVFAAQLPVFELHLNSESDHIRIGFLPDDGSTPTALALWDQGGETWWCNTSTAYGAELLFEPLKAGDYPIYVAVEGEPNTMLTGSLYVTEEKSSTE